MKNQFNNPLISKYPKIDCTNDAMMVHEGIRVPALRSLDIQRSSQEEIKNAKLAYKKAKAKDSSKALNEIAEIIVKNLDKVRFNLTKIQII